MTPELVRRLSVGRWLIPVLAAMAGEQGTRFGALARRLLVSKSILSATLDRLESDGWIYSNPGHGHPLRPEYYLTDAGVAAALWSREVMDQRRRLGLEPGALGRWSLPVLIDLEAGRKRFSVLQQSLAPITPRALSLELSALRNIKLIDRRPPEPLYGLTPKGRNLAEAILTG